MKKSNKKVISYWLTLFIGVSLCYFIWLSWLKLTDFIGDANLVWLITGAIVLFAIVLGHLSIKKVVERFT